MADFKGYSKTVRVTASTLAVTGRFSLLGVQYAHTASALGVVTIQDSTDSSGGTVAVLGCSAGQAEVYIEFPGQGIRIDEGVYIDIGPTSGVTIFYG